MTRSRRSRRPVHPAAFLVVLVAAVFALVQRFAQVPSRSTAAAPAAEEAVYTDMAVVQIYDGDTFKLANGEKVRMVGIDTPEARENNKLFRDAVKSGQDVKKILAMGRKASVYTKGLLEDRRVRLEFDIQKRDKYGRLLAYVYRVDDGLFVNEDIIRNGYAYPMTIPPNVRHADEFRKLFHEAQKAKRGLWAGQ